MFDIDAKFNFFTEANLEKSSKFNPLDYPVGDDKRYERMIFEGLASDASEDSEEESMEPNGFIIDRFLKHGLINLDHLTSRSPINKSRFWIGAPLDAKVKDNKFFVKCQLWKKSPEARAFYDKALEMQESGTNRKPGFSIEGKALERDKKNPKKITKALITNVAMTMTPVNANTYADIVKGIQKQDYIDYSESDNISFKQANILLEMEKDGYLLSIDKNFVLKAFPTEGVQSDDFKELYKSYMEGHISSKILWDYLQNFR